MKSLHISDLSIDKELDRKAMSAVHGGQDNQAIGTSQSNLQGMVAAANVGNGSLFCGPATIQSDNTFHQDASNTNTATNVDFALLVGLGMPHLR
ncbi:hypothetical protein [Caenimonas soli]|uniref:hypothetical protein n=1 Tax=Caenimonas soli TaxID=2735555 RepID=UPI0015549D5E|nr:hypothetical protein [Caenimonas soli]NPC56482.1 hypothetical protein [Caenimonas soli]